LAARNSKSSLEKRLERLQKQNGGTIKIESIAAIVDETVSSVMSEVLEKDHTLVHELELLRQYIDEAKAEITDLRPDDVKKEHLPIASGELDAIVKATEDATNEIMDATEVIGQLGDTIGGDHADAIFDATMRIYQACGFQDITGQRVTKIVATLKHIEDKVDALAIAFGDSNIDKIKKAPKTKTKKSAKKPAKKLAKNAPKKAAKKSKDKSPGKKIDNNKAVADDDLLEGPQLPGDAIKQDEVDALLASFD
jgi:chemotaxis protein CheZ